jgi:hypothetical protein
MLKFVTKFGNVKAIGTSLHELKVIFEVDTWFGFTVTVTVKDSPSQPAALTGTIV